MDRARRVAGEAEGARGRATVREAKRRRRGRMGDGRKCIVEESVKCGKAVVVGERGGGDE